jgi:hypothetical protein
VIKKVWEVDPLECPKCGAEMKVISFIDESFIMGPNIRHDKYFFIKLENDGFLM